jgi:predicted 3-demethylubiquinone-9 3-methyltransferase (glyoxalase superfamily)
MPQITPNLWFDTEGLDAAQFYTSIFPNSEIGAVSHYSDAGPREAGMVLSVEFTLDRQPFVAINGGPEFPFTEAVSFSISCKDQAETDYYWDRLAEGGEESQCGWLKDRYGVSWQVVPAEFVEIMSDPAPQRVGRAVQAMLGMKKLDIAALRAAADGR